jgi:PP-loop superfamily ATP-utilizing enzyme
VCDERRKSARVASIHPLSRTLAAGWFRFRKRKRGFGFLIAESGGVDSSELAALLGFQLLWILFPFSELL